MSTEHNSPRRYAEDVDLDSQFPGAALRAPEPEHDSPEPVEMSGVDALPEDLDPDYAEFLRQKKAKASVIPDHAPRPQDRKAKASDEPEEEYPNAVMDEATGILMVTIHHDGLVVASHGVRAGADLVRGDVLGIHHQRRRVADRTSAGRWRLPAS